VTKKRFQPQESLPHHNDLVASIDRLAEDLRSLLLLIARISGALPPVPKP